MGGLGKMGASVCLNAFESESRRFCVCVRTGVAHALACIAQHGGRALRYAAEAAPGTSTGTQKQAQGVRSRAASLVRARMVVVVVAAAVAAVVYAQRRRSRYKVRLQEGSAEGRCQCYYVSCVV